MLPFRGGGRENSAHRTDLELRSSQSIVDGLSDSPLAEAKCYAGRPGPGQISAITPRPMTNNDNKTLSIRYARESKINRRDPGRESGKVPVSRHPRAFANTLCRKQNLVCVESGDRHNLEDQTRAIATIRLTRGEKRKTIGAIYSLTCASPWGTAPLGIEATTRSKASGPAR